MIGSRCRARALRPLPVSPLSARDIPLSDLNQRTRDRKGRRGKGKM